MSGNVELDKLIKDLETVEKLFKDKYRPAVKEYAWQGLTPAPAKGSALAVFARDILPNVVKSGKPLPISEDTLQYLAGTGVGDDLTDEAKNKYGDAANV